MRLLLLLAPLLAPQGDVSKLCKSFIKHCRDLNNVEIVSGIRKLEFSNKPEAAEALLTGYGHIADHYSEKWKAKEKIARKMNKIKWRVDKKGKRSGNYDGWAKHQLNAQRITDQLKRMDNLQRSITRALSRIKSADTVDSLIERFRTDKDWRTRSCLAGVLAERQEKRIIPELINQLNDEPEPIVRVAILDAIFKRTGSAPDDQALDQVMARLRDKVEPWQVRVRCAQIIQRWRRKDKVPDLIEIIAESDGRFKFELNDVLKALTGVDKHGNIRAWEAWWDRYGEDFLAGKIGPGPGGGDPLATATFYNIPIKTNRVVFILDRTGSMEEESPWKEMIATGSSDIGGIRLKGKRKIDVARYNLKKALAMLLQRTIEEEVEVYFNIITYNQNVEPWKKKLVLLNDNSFERAKEYINRIKPNGMTNIHDALVAGLRLGVKGAHPRIATGGGKEVEPDTIFLLSDGLPTAGQITSPDLIRHKMKGRNKHSRICINTIYVGLRNDIENIKGHDFMRYLAADHEGKFSSPEKRN